MFFSFIELMQETKQSPGAETAHDCFISIQYVINCNMGVESRPWYALSHNNHFAIVAWPGLILRICFVIGGIERTQYNHLSHLSTKLGRQFSKHEFLIKRSSFSQFLTFSLSKFFSIIHILSVSQPQLNTWHWAHIHSFACLL